MSTKNLWGDSLEDIDEVKTPSMILREQAELLEKGTSYRLRGSVRTEGHGGTLATYFEIVVPQLNDYTYEVLEIRHGVGFYPLKIRDAVNGKLHECKDEEEFLAQLGNVLSSPGVRKVVAGLAAQAAS